MFVDNLQLPLKQKELYVCVALLVLVMDLNATQRWFWMNVFQALEVLSWFNYKYVFYSATYLKFISLKILCSWGNHAIFKLCRHRLSLEFNTSGISKRIWIRVDTQRRGLCNVGMQRKFSSSAERNGIRKVWQRVQNGSEAPTINSSVVRAQQTDWRTSW